MTHRTLDLGGVVVATTLPFRPDEERRRVVQTAVRRWAEQAGPTRPPRGPLFAEQQAIVRRDTERALACSRSRAAA